MKYIYLLFAALLFAGCNHSQGDIEFDGTAPGVDFGHVSVLDHSFSNTIFRTDIQSGKFTLGKRFLQYSGYYNLSYTSNSGPSQAVEIYLEPGKYNVKLDFINLNNYPVITSSSKLQTELSAYHAVADSIIGNQRKVVVALNDKIKALKDRLLRPGEYSAIAGDLQDQEMRANQVDELSIFEAFMKKYPDNEIAAHLMLKLRYQNDPVAYYKSFQKFSAAAKSTDEGKELESKLQQLTKLAGGGDAPEIKGTTPDGKTVDITALNKKIILLDFWRSGTALSRDNHSKMIGQLLPEFGSKGLGIVSVSLDDDRDKWLGALALDKMSWPQLSDLKGDDSPNADNWGIKSIPTYYLLDGQGKIIAHISEFGSIDNAITEYLAKH